MVMRTSSTSSSMVFKLCFKPYFCILFGGVQAVLQALLLHPFRWFSSCTSSPTSASSSMVLRLYFKRYFCILFDGTQDALRALLLHPPSCAFKLCWPCLHAHVLVSIIRLSVVAVAVFVVRGRAPPRSSCTADASHGPPEDLAAFQGSTARDETLGQVH